jgi:hypothetical protein
MQLAVEWWFLSCLCLDFVAQATLIEVQVGMEEAAELIAKTAHRQFFAAAPIDGPAEQRDDWIVSAILRKHGV